MAYRMFATWTVVCVASAMAPNLARAQSTGSPPSAVPTAAADQSTTRGDAAVLDRRISLHLDHVTFKQAIDTIAAVGHVRIAYSRTHVPLQKIVTLVIDSITVGDALTVLLRGTQIGVAISPGGVLMLDDVDAPPARAEAGTLSGTVTDSVTGLRVPYTTVLIEETAQAATTNAKGVYAIAGVAAGKYHVTVRRVGFLPRTKPMVIGGGKVTTLDFALQRQPTKLDEMVTTATGDEHRYEVGNDITTVSGDSVMGIAPITDLTDMLATRVPGLDVQSTSGNPGAPSRLRLRGLSSIQRSDDPIVIVDGVRVYSNQSGSYSNLSGTSSGGGSNLGIAGRVPFPNGAVTTAGTGGYAAPSPIDQIDPNSIETIEVMKGPSAAALYGSDAGNGVIIITTKRGVAGRTHWSLALNQGIEEQPGEWPVNYFLFGHGTGLEAGPSGLCSIFLGPAQCTRDSVVGFQALNDSRLSPLGEGMDRRASLGVSGGSGLVTFALTGTASDRSGYLHLPAEEVDRFEKFHGFPAPDWMKHPDQYGTWGGTSNLRVQLGHSQTFLALTSSIFHSAQQQSSLQSALAALENSYIDSTTLAAQPLLSEYYERAQLNTLTSTNALSLQNWTPVSWLPISATFGLSTANSSNNALTPRDYLLGVADSLGEYSASNGQTVTETINLGTVVRFKWVSLATGINVIATNTQNMSASTTSLPLGVTQASVFTCLGSCAAQSSGSQSTYGWYLAPTLNPFSRLFISPGFRLDGGTASGRNASLTAFPKLDVSYIAIDRRNNSAVPAITMLRPRVAFGIAGVQPGPVDKLRLYSSGTVIEVDSGNANGSPVSIATLNSLGNTKLTPEQSREFEGGLDAGFLNDRLNITTTGYYKMRYNAILGVPIAPSVGSAGAATQERNIGTIRNEGLEATMNVDAVETRSVSWSFGAIFSKNVNDVVSLIPGQAPIVTMLGANYESILRPGYALNGYWAKPILSYNDANHDGIIEPGEVRVGDSVQYMGSARPKFELSYFTTLAFFNRRLTFNTGFDFQNGVTQLNTNSALLLDVNNPKTPPPSLQAAIAAYQGGLTAAGLIQTVNTLRWNTIALNYLLPASFARAARVSSLTVGIQGSNLMLWTNYRGKDPGVNAYANGNLTADTGQLPQPRVWSVHIRMGN